MELILSLDEWKDIIRESLDDNYAITVVDAEGFTEFKGNINHELKRISISQPSDELLSSIYKILEEFCLPNFELIEIRRMTPYPENNEEP